GIAAGDLGQHRPQELHRTCRKHQLRLWTLLAFDLEDELMGLSHMTAQTTDRFSGERFVVVGRGKRCESVEMGCHRGLPPVSRSNSRLPPVRNKCNIQSQ